MADQSPSAAVGSICSWTGETATTTTLGTTEETPAKHGKNQTEVTCDEIDLIGLLSNSAEQPVP